MYCLNVTSHQFPVAKITIANYLRFIVLYKMFCYILGNLIIEFVLVVYIITLLTITNNNNHKRNTSFPPLLIQFELLYSEKCDFHPMYGILRTTVMWRLQQTTHIINSAQTVDVINITDESTIFRLREPGGQAFLCNQEEKYFFLTQCAIC